MPRKIDWEAIKKAFESGETNVSALSKKFGPSRNAIMARRDKETWQTRQQVGNLAHSKVIDIATRRAADKLGGIDAIADDIVSDLSAHLELSRIAVKAAQYTADRFFEGKIQPSRMQNEADVLNSLLMALGRAATIGREVHGLRPGTPSVSTEEADAPGKEYVVKHPPAPALEAESA